MSAPQATVSDFTQYSGMTLTAAEQLRVAFHLGRARRALNAELTLPDAFTADETMDLLDAEVELAWLWWEAEKASVMEILAIPVSQLSLGTLFWTKSGNDRSQESLPTLNRILHRWGTIGHRRVVLEGEIDYPEV